MGKILADRVLETSTTTGTGAYTLAGAVTGYRAASAVCVNGDYFDYYAEEVHEGGVPIGGWETGLGTWGTGNILTRSVIYASSNNNAAVNWAAGTRRIGLSVVAQTLNLTGESLVVTAGAALGGHRIVYQDATGKAQYASNQVAAHALIMLGMTTGAVEVNAPVVVQHSGEITEPSWAWILEQPVYLGTNGLITQTPPANPALFQRIVGFPMSATKLFLRLREPIFIN